MRFASVILISLLPLNSLAGGNLVISTTQTDPGRLCQELANALPKNIESLRKLGDLVQEISASTDYFECNERPGGCKTHTLQFEGLALDVLTSPSFKEPWIFGITVSKPNWNFLGDIRVGQSLPVIEERFGVLIPRDTSPVNLEGECTPLTIWHSEGQVTSFDLDCQACY